MVAKITAPRSIRAAMEYNEHKVAERAAICIYAGNFLKEAAELNRVEKMERFSQLIALNQRTHRNTLHASLNFAVGEEIGRDKLILIAREYMERIGFGEQPFLVYQHLDAAHPHVHIVSTNIQPGGAAISMHKIGRDKSEPARIAIEEKYELVKAQGRDKSKEYELKPVSIEKLQYGKRATKQAIGNALQYVLREYRFRSLPEFNAILRLYNLKADPGLPGSRIHSHKGLLYQILDEKGKGIGVPIKASGFHFKPTIQFLETKFEANLHIDPVLIGRVRAAIDQTLGKKPSSFDAFTKILAPQRIVPVPYINKQGVLYGLSFVDLQGKIVLKASDLGKGYSGQAILRRLGLEPNLNPGEKERPGKLPFPGHDPFGSGEKRTDIERAADILLRPEFQAGLPGELSHQPSKKRKGQSRKI
ncbi:MAG: relaxase/mobilization nuclease domain-containing protein [Bacteroidota bacterium]|nr:relaxase/mobilization nuclease domain-containing protein [Bacteroidota bacterium]